MLKNVLDSVENKKIYWGSLGILYEYVNMLRLQRILLKKYVFNALDAKFDPSIYYHLRDKRVLKFENVLRPVEI